MKIGNLYVHVPARGGSKRVPSKNLRYLAGKPLLSYAVEAGLACEAVPDVFVNTDSDTLAALGEHLGASVYRRPAALGADDATGEDFTADFMRAFSPDTLMMISPVCPLLDAADIAAALAAYEESDADTLISCSTTQMQTFCDGEPVNIDPHGPLAPSQANPAITVCNWAVTIWNTETFLKSYETNRSGYFGQRRLFWPIEPLKAVKISTEQDFAFAEQLMQLGAGEEPAPARYWSPEAG